MAGAAATCVPEPSARGTVGRIAGGAGTRLLQATAPAPITRPPSPPRLGMGRTARPRLRGGGGGAGGGEHAGGGLRSEGSAALGRSLARTGGDRVASPRCGGSDSRRLLAGRRLR